VELFTSDAVHIHSVYLNYEIGAKVISSTAAYSL